MTKSFDDVNNTRPAPIFPTEFLRPILNRPKVEFPAVVMVVTNPNVRAVVASYQGTPSGVPQERPREAGFSRCAMAIPSRHSESSRVIADARTFFVTSSILGQQNLLQPERAARLFLDVLYDYRAQAKYLLHEFVVMPDHFHLLMTVGWEMSIERAVQLIKGGFAFRAGRELGFRAPVWQKGFSEIRTCEPRAFADQRGYIRENPVRKRFVERAEDYPYSSAHAGFELDDPPQRLKPVPESRIGGTPEQAAKKARI